VSSRTVLEGDVGSCGIGVAVVGLVFGPFLGVEVGVEVSLVSAEGWVSTLCVAFVA